MTYPIHINGFLRPLLLCACLLAAAIPASAQQYPSRPIRMILPQAPGSTTDTVGRIVFTATAERLNQQIVVDNRPGAGGIIGMEVASRAAPDGYTLAGVAASMMAIAPHVYGKLGYDPMRDFVPIGMFVLSETALCVNDKLPVKSVREFVELAKAKAGQLAVGSAGVGSTSYLGALLFT